MKNGVRHQSCKALTAHSSALSLSLWQQSVLGLQTERVHKDNCQHSSEYASTGDSNCRMHAAIVRDNDCIQCISLPAHGLAQSMLSVHIASVGGGIMLQSWKWVKAGIHAVCMYRPAFIITLWFFTLSESYSVHCHKWLQPFCKVDVIIAIKAPPLLPQSLYQGLYSLFIDQLFDLLLMVLTDSRKFTP